jgi:hypothetical protein
MRVRSLGLIGMLTLLALPALCLAAEPLQAPEPANAPLLVAGDYDHGRVQPIDVIAGHTWALPELIDGLESDSPDTRARCGFLLGQIASPDAVEPLMGALEDPDRTVRMFAGMSLARMGDFAGYHAARAAYQGNRWWIRYWAVDALARLNRVPDRAMDDPDPLVRAMAQAGDGGSWGPVVAEEQYAGPEGEMLLGDVIFRLTEYLVAEMDWWWHSGHYEQILRGNETVVWLDPSYLEGLTNAGYLYWSLGRDVEALSAYRRAVALHPDDWESHFELGFFYFNAQKRFDDAIDEFARARELEAPPVQARMHAHALEHDGQPEKAAEVWREILDENPNDGVARSNLTRLEEILGSGVKAK